VIFAPTYLAEDPFTESYYADRVYDYTNIVFRVNGTKQKGEYEVRVAEDGLSVSFQRAICSRFFNKQILRIIMGENYHESSARIFAWDDMVLEMQKKKVRPRNGLFWGEPQMVRLNWKCTGTPTPSPIISQRHHNRNQPPVGAIS